MLCWYQLGYRLPIQIFSAVILNALQSSIFIQRYEHIVKSMIPSLDTYKNGIGFFSCWLVTVKRFQARGGHSTFHNEILLLILDEQNL